MAVKQKRIRCARCGERETVTKGERGPASIYCDLCRDEVKREQNALRAQAYRQRKASYRGGALTAPPSRATDFVEALKTRIYIAHVVACQVPLGVKTKLHVDATGTDETWISVGKSCAERPSIRIFLLKAIGADDSAIGVRRGFSLSTNFVQESDCLLLR